MKWSKVIGLYLCVILLTGCAKSEKIEQGVESIELNEIAGTQSNETADGQTYNKEYNYTSESGKVVFDVEIDLPENVNLSELKIYDVEGYLAPKKDESINYFVDNRNIVDEENYSYPEMNVDLYMCKLDDGTELSYDDSFAYATQESGYYTRVQANTVEYLNKISESQVDFMTSGECIEEVKSAMNTLGYNSEDFEYNAYALNHADLAKLQEICLEEMLIENDEKKEEWISQDDAYIIYAYQKLDGIPVFYEMMPQAKLWASYTIDNAPIIAVYSTRGLEDLTTSFVYNVSESDKKVSIKTFEDVASKIENRYENILNDVTYKIDTVKLLYMIKSAQDCETVPIWYCGVTGSDGSMDTMIIDAVTGDEIDI